MSFIVLKCCFQSEYPLIVTPVNKIWAPKTCMLVLSHENTGKGDDNSKTQSLKHLEYDHFPD